MSAIKKRILIVDDDFDYLTQLKMQVESFGFDVETANSRKQAELKLETDKPDLAIYDLMMEDPGRRFHPGIQNQAKVS